MHVRRRPGATPQAESRPDPTVRRCVVTVSPYEPPAGGGELVHYQPQGRSVSTLREWAEAARLAHVVAQSLVKTSFVPKEYRGKPDEATAAILAGDELGFSPIASINAFDVIEGRAAPKALTLRAVVQSRGHEVEEVESTAQRCVMRGRRAGAEKWQTVTWTIERARKLNLANKKNWREQPENMLIARATSQICRLIGADAILGIPYSAEELQDQADEPSASNGTRAGLRARRQTPIAIAPAQPSTPAAEPPAAAGPPPLPGEAGYSGSDEPAAEAAQPADWIGNASCEKHGPHGGTVDCPDCLYPADDASVEQMAADAEVAEAAEAVAMDDDAAESANSDAEVAPTVDPDVTDEPAEPVDRGKLMRHVFALLNKADVGDRHVYAAGVLGREVATYGDLSAAELQTLVGNLRDIAGDL